MKSQICKLIQESIYVSSMSSFILNSISQHHAKINSRDAQTFFNDHIRTKPIRQATPVTCWIGPAHRAVALAERESRPSRPAKRHCASLMVTDTDQGTASSEHCFLQRRAQSSLLRAAPRAVLTDKEGGGSCCRNLKIEIH